MHKHSPEWKQNKTKHKNICIQKESYYWMEIEVCKTCLIPTFQGISNKEAYKE